MKRAEIAIVGGGPAGAALAIELARRGRETVLFERLAQPRWRAAGVYSSPLTRRRLVALGLNSDEVSTLIRPISAMVVRPVDGSAACRLEFPAPQHACGVDRVRLERVLLDHAQRHGARIHEGSPVRSVELDGSRARLVVSGSDGPTTWQVGLVVGADGPSSIVARSAGVLVPTRLFRRAALTVHRADPGAAPAAEPMEAEMLVGAGWYCGVAPVPNRRVNLGLVLSEPELRRQVRLADGALPDVIERMLSGLPAANRPWLAASATDGVRVALPLAHRVRRAAGRQFLLVGDSAGFVDPLSGEGLQRAFASAELAATAIAAWAAGDRAALAAYDRRLRARFRGKDALSWLLQLFLVQPALSGYALRNLERRPELRRTLSLALADLVPASRALDPRFLARVLAPSR